MESSKSSGLSWQALGLVTLLVSAVPSFAQDKKGDVPVAVFEARFVDGAVMKLVVRDERLLVDSRYGQLTIRIADVQRIDFALRVPLETRQRIDAALADLVNKDPQRRDAAMFELYDLREYAYPFLAQAAAGKDRDVAMRAIQIIEKLRDTVPPEQLEVPPFDVVYTEDARLPGRIVAPALRVTTVAFDNQEVELDRIRSLRSANEKPGAATALADPGTLSRFPTDLGKKAVFQLTAPKLDDLGRGIYGTDVYSVDSSLARAAIHAGVLRPGQTGLVRVTFVGMQQAYRSSVRNGVVSSEYGPWQGFRLEAVR